MRENMSLIAFLLYFVALLVPVKMAADETECSMPKFLDCFKCDSRIHSFCADKFNKTDSVSLSHVVRCESECLKWDRQIDPEDPDTDWYILRMCKTDVDIEMYLSPDMCIGESRPGSGSMCTCQEDRCNHAIPTIVTNIHLVALSLISLHTVFWTECYG